MLEITHPVGNYKEKNRGFCAAIICHNFSYSVATLNRTERHQGKNIITLHKY